MIYVAVVLFAILSVFLLASVIYLKTGLFKTFYHDILEWHQPGKYQRYFDGCSVHCVCKHCGKEIMQDSQGNWF